MVPKKQNLTERIENLLKSSKVLLFMKGSPDVRKNILCVKFNHILQVRSIIFWIVHIGSQMWFQQAYLWNLSGYQVRCASFIYYCYTCIVLYWLYCIVLLHNNRLAGINEEYHFYLIRSAKYSTFDILADQEVCLTYYTILLCTYTIQSLGNATLDWNTLFLVN